MGFMDKVSNIGKMGEGLSADYTGGKSDITLEPCNNPSGRQMLNSLVKSHPRLRVTFPRLLNALTDFNMNYQK
jgi:hypothetical protein